MPVPDGTNNSDLARQYVYRGLVALTLLKHTWRGADHRCRTHSVRPCQRAQEISRRNVAKLALHGELLASLGGACPLAARAAFADNNSIGREVGDGACGCAEGIHK